MGNLVSFRLLIKLSNFGRTKFNNFDVSLKFPICSWKRFVVKIFKSSNSTSLRKSYRSSLPSPPPPPRELQYKNAELKHIVFDSLWHPHIYYWISLCTKKKKKIPLRAYMALILGVWVPLLDSVKTIFRCLFDPQIVYSPNT